MQPLLKFISININAAIYWPPPLISQLHYSSFLGHTIFHSLVWMFHVTKHIYLYGKVLMYLMSNLALNLDQDT